MSGREDFVFPAVTEGSVDGTGGRCQIGMIAHLSRNNENRGSITRLLVKSVHLLSIQLTSCQLRRASVNADSEAREHAYPRIKCCYHSRRALSHQRADRDGLDVVQTPISEMPTYVSNILLKPVVASKSTKKY